MLKKLLLQLCKKLPNPTNLTDEDLFEIPSIIRQALDYESSIAERAEGATKGLPEDLRLLCEALIHMEVVADLLGDIASDSMLSLFYNHSGDELDLLLLNLAQFEDPLAPHLERAYALAKKPFAIVPSCNWVSLNMERDPFSVLSPEIDQKIEEIGKRMEELRDTSWPRATARYREWHRRFSPGKTH